jgi:hypothetical protein
MEDLAVGLADEAGERGGKRRQRWQLITAGRIHGVQE